MPFVLILVAIAAGFANPFQSGFNAQLNKDLAKPVWATILVYSTGLFALLLVQLFVREAIPTGRYAQIPWWAWLGGLISIVSTVAGLTLAHRLGSGIFTGASVTAALLTSVALDHFGLIGFKPHPASPARLAGCVLMIAGLWLVSRF